MSNKIVQTFTDKADGVSELSIEQLKFTTPNKIKGMELSMHNIGLKYPMKTRVSS